MVEQITFQTIFQFLQTAGILIGIGYYVTTLRNAQSNRMKEMVFNRMRDKTPEWQRLTRMVEPAMSGWKTAEEYYQKYNADNNLEISIARVHVIHQLDGWGFLLSQGLIDEKFVTRMHTPWFIIRWWESFKPLILDGRERLGDPDHHKDFEYLYNVVKKKYPHLSADTKLFDRAYE